MSNHQGLSDVPDSPSAAGMPVGADDLLNQLDRVVDTQLSTPSAAEGLSELTEWMAEEQPPLQEQSERSASLSLADAPSTKASKSGLPAWEQPRSRDTTTTADLTESGASAVAASVAARDQRPAALAAGNAKLSVTAAGSFALAGRLDVRSAADIRQALHEAVDSGEGDLVLDLKGIDSWDATGLGVIMGAHRRANRLHRRLVLREVPHQMMRLLVSTRLHRILAIENPADEGAVQTPGLDRLDSLPASSAEAGERR